MPRSTIEPQRNDLPPPVLLADEERAALLDLARIALATAVGAASPSSLAAAREQHADLSRRAAAFVTLTEHGALRGCIGLVDASARVTNAVVEAATWAALEDPRFTPVCTTELRRLHVDVSVLGPLVPIADPESFRLGIDGIVVERGGRRGLLLPEVADGLGNDRTAMLDMACRKAGLTTRAWRDHGTTVSVFRTDRFGGDAAPEEPGATPGDATL